MKRETVTEKWMRESILDKVKKGLDLIRRETGIPEELTIVIQQKDSEFTVDFYRGNPYRA